MVKREKQLASSSTSKTEQSRLALEKAEIITVLLCSTKASESRRLN
jgi:hypothetical protein